MGKYQKMVHIDYPMAFHSYWIKKNARAIIANPLLTPTDDEYDDWMDKQI